MMNRFSTDQCSLLVIDVQGRLAELMHHKQRLFKHLSTLIQAAELLDIPIHWFEQYPQGLGPTKPEIKDLLGAAFYHEKITFSACGVPEFMCQLRASGRRQVIVSGIEAHVCVYQTVLDLLAQGFAVKVNQQAVASRAKDNKKLGLHNMQLAGAELTSTEMILFELMQSAEHPRFREISALLK
ncbi:isochorismatase family protein [Marinicella meishanensis]|uniref:isochorismatase family protein n=1 Tax=Marinicella meishanensis TaxID=2873263 RepID=UPI001CC100E2|nr:isochorismatase family protein [Marinicella sp. NBU2979]